MRYQANYWKMLVVARCLSWTNIELLSKRLIKLDTKRITELVMKVKIKATIKLIVQHATFAAEFASAVSAAGGGRSAAAVKMEKKMPKSASTLMSTSMVRSTSTSASTRFSWMSTHGRNHFNFPGKCEYFLILVFLSQLKVCFVAKQWSTWKSCFDHLLQEFLNIRYLTPILLFLSHRKCRLVTKQCSTCIFFILYSILYR